ncbi:MAG: PEP-CTERM sorting domain-containing protein [Isosphaerales bacterium]
METFSDGTLFGTTSGSGTANGKGSATVTIDLVITGGTGFFAGYTGEATITATITSTGPTTESVMGSYVGTLSVPEPSTLALLAPAVAALAVVVVRRQRREAMTQ